MKRLVVRHSRILRWLHWINVPLLALMIYSGILIYWANDVYRIGWGNVTLVRFFPDWFYTLFRLHHRLAEGMAWHFTIMWMFVLNGIAYVIYAVASGEWRGLVPSRTDLASLGPVILHDLAGVGPEPVKSGKYNAAQKVAYTGVILMGAGSVLTGLAIYKPVQLAWLAAGFGGYQPARAIHFYLTVGFVLFAVIHVTQVIRAGWNTLRSMVTGFEVLSNEEQSHA